MGPVPKKKSLTVRRVLVLLLAYIMLAVCGGVATSVLVIPGVIGANNVAKAVIPSLKVENVDFDVTSLPQKSTMYASDGTTVITDFLQPEPYRRAAEEDFQGHAAGRGGA